MTLQAQTNNNEIAGTYFLKNVRETGAGFRLQADGSFEFFFSYGALDRQGKGNWKLEGDSLTFTSTTQQPDFIPGPSSKTNDPGVLIRITGGNNSINPFFMATLTSGGTVNKASSRGSGELYFPPGPADRISIQFEFCPEKEFTYTPTDSKHNLFSFAVQPTLFDIQFRNWKMKWEPGIIKGSLPFSGGNQVVFSK